MLKNLSAKYYQDNKVRLLLKLMNDTEIFPNKKDTKIISMVVNDIEIFHKMKNKDYLSIEKKYYKMRESTSL